MQLYLFCQLSNDQRYDIDNGFIAVVGKTNSTEQDWITPYGVATPVTPKQYAQLKQNPIFNLHVRSGYLRVGLCDIETRRQSMAETAKQTGQLVKPNRYNAGKATQKNILARSPFH